MATFTDVFRNVGSPRMAPGMSGSAGDPVGTEYTLTFASSTEDSAAGVFGVVGSTNANIAFTFNEVTPRTGLPRDLEISESGTLRMVVTFPADYEGENYTYTTTAGVQHAGTFPSGNGTVNY